MIYKCCALRGRGGSKTYQQLELGSVSFSNALTSSQKNAMLFIEFEL